MTSALTLKELRESAGVAVLGLAGLVLVALTAIGLSPLIGMLRPSRAGSIPFVDDSFGWQFPLAAGALAMALGFKQSLGDLWGDAQLFLLHRPISRRTFYVTKIVVGLSLYFALTGLAILIYAVWAASSGTHASPFAWSMTVPVWITWLAVSLVYLGALLSGIRPAAWMGTRLMPLAAACAIATLAAALPPLAGLAVIIAAAVALVALILFMAETRDFA
ncbi:MAG TPA: hypothetical protein VFV87_16870 [Pirellulaceae bacterium]|nr:hypothetical protein [Pirellulaceae bacterium]